MDPKLDIVPAGYDAQYEECLATLVITNVVATGNLDVKNVKVRIIGQNNPGYIYSRHMFAALINRLVSPKSTSLVYVRGVIVCMGTQSVAEALLACHKYVHLLRRQGVKCRLVGFKPYNFVFSVMTFPLDLNRLARDYSYMVQYTEKFPGATIRCKQMNLEPPTAITIEAFHSGKLNITGATSEEEAHRVFEHVYYSILVHIRIAPGITREVDEVLLVEMGHGAGDFVKTITNVEHEKMLKVRKSVAKKGARGSAAAAAAASVSKTAKARNPKERGVDPDDLYEMSKFSRFAANAEVDDDQLLEAGKITDRVLAADGLFEENEHAVPVTQAGGDTFGGVDDEYIPTLDDVMNDMHKFADC